MSDGELVQSGERGLGFGLPFGQDMERMSGPNAATDVLAQLDQGIEKRLKIFYKPFGGNDLFFYNQNLAPILDVMALYQAEYVIFTNQRRMPEQDLIGFTLFDQMVTLSGRPSLRNWLKLSYPRGTYEFTCEYSFAAWSRNVGAIVAARAFLQ